MSDTDDDAGASPPATPTTIEYPRWLWAVGVAVVLIVSVAVVGLVRYSGHDDTSQAGGVVERLIPSANDKILQQAAIGVDLAPGYDAELAVNGQPLPLDEVVVEKGLNTVTFQPGPGKTFEQWPAGQSCVTATYWPSATPLDRNTRSWCFTVV